MKGFKLRGNVQYWAKEIRRRQRSIVFLEKIANVEHITLWKGCATLHFKMGKCRVKFEHLSHVYAHVWRILTIDVGQCAGMCFYSVDLKNTMKERSCRQPDTKKYIIIFVLFTHL